MITLPRLAVVLCAISSTTVWAGEWSNTTSDSFSAHSEEVIVTIESEFDDIIYDEDLHDFHSPKKRSSEDYPMQDYNRSCNHMIDMWPGKVVKIITPFNGAKQYPAGLTCEWEFMGNPRCIPQIYCPVIDLRQTADCGFEYFRISDGVGGEVKLCGADQGFQRPYAVRGGSYLFLNLETADSTAFDRMYQGINCVIMCHEGPRPRVPSERLPDADTPREEYTCLCGRQKLSDNDRIVGGETAKRNEFPWQAAIVKRGTRKPFCGASLINSQYVLTAAHCMNGIYKISSIEVILNGYNLDLRLVSNSPHVDAELGKNGSMRGPGYDQANLTDKEDKSLRFAIEKIIIHRLYDHFADYDSDVCLLKLRKAVRLKDQGSGSEVIPACLPQPGDEKLDLTGKKAIVSGWGLADEKAGATTKLLQKLEIPIIDWSKCQHLLNEFGFSENMFCGGYEEGGKDACQGDSGGPLVLKKDEKFIQIGIVSWGEGCARKGRPGVYVKLANYIPWIREKTRGATWCRQ